MLRSLFAQHFRFVNTIARFVLVISVFLNASYAIAAPLPPSSDVGFMPGTLWVSDDTPSIGQTITLYTVVYNGSEGTLVGTVEFLDGKMLLGKREVSLSSGEVKDISFDWKATRGTHIFSVTFNNAKVANPGKDVATVTPTYPTSKTPLTIVVKGGKNNLTAQALGSQEVSQLDAIDTLQQKVTEKIPPAYSTYAKALGRRLEVFRMTMYFIFEDKRARIEHVLNVDALHSSAYAPLFEKGQTTTVPQPLSTAQTAYAYGKLGFFSFLSWFYGTFYAFYVLGVSMIVFLVRSLVRLIRG